MLFFYLLMHNIVICWKLTETTNKTEWGNIIKRKLFFPDRVRLSQDFKNTHYHIAGSHVLQNASSDDWGIVCGHAVWSVGHVNKMMNVAIRLYCAQLVDAAWPILHTLHFIWRWQKILEAKNTKKKKKEKRRNISNLLRVNRYI